MENFLIGSKSHDFMLIIHLAGTYYFIGTNFSDPQNEISCRTFGLGWLPHSTQHVPEPDSF